MSSSVEPVELAEVDAFDHECDVLVVGFGVAGAAAAYEAAAAGANVIVLERASGAGGSSGQSGGELYLGGGTGTQKALGFDDTPEDMYAFLEKALGPHADTEKLRLYCDGSVEHHDWFVARGVEFKHTLFEGQAWMPFTDDGLMWLGENAWPYNDIAKPAPRGHRPPAPGFAGNLLMQKLEEAVTAAGAATHTDTVASHLVMDGGRVAGLVARRFGAPVTYRARKAVVLTTGGFVDNEEMLAHHAPVLVGLGKVSDGLDDGSGIRMAAAIGAATRRMGVVEISMTALPALVARGMLVNGRGQRFVNEDVYPGIYSTHAILQEPGPYWGIIDEEGFESIPPGDLWQVQPKYVEETLAELEEALGMLPGALEHTVEVYNRHAENGEDPHFHKDARWLRPLKGPFAAVDPRDGFFGTGAGRGSGAAGFTLGGLHTTVDGEVLNVSGEHIPGLYAAGRASSGMHGEGYISGTSLGDGSFFGRRAGKAAAREE
ncbi:FAD-dependent oxidoreductase [Actinocorallia populi]|uniref:FAD-dependent oxidoreductase n=1 Tax=Actinocorallia populi TaxID=2079200 RepID=UPI000D095528|nr:FAD-dependent oxidoreductase [Actinocorallia populi]